MDEFPLSSLLRPDGSIDAQRYPNFARLAGGGTWYPRATTVHEFTTQAVPAVLTGQLPRVGELPTLNDHPENLFTLLGNTYSFRVIEPVTRLCPDRYCPEAHVTVPFVDRSRGLLYDVGVGYLYRVLPASLRVGLPPIGDRWGGFDQAGDAGTRRRLLGAMDVNDVNLAIERTDHQPRTEFSRFLRLIRPNDPGRTLYFLHVMLPTRPTACCRRDASTGTRRRSTGSRTTRSTCGESRPCSSTRRSSATCCRSATRIGCSGRSSNG